jgi:RNA polymerase-binding transcription factor DksA
MLTQKTNLESTLHTLKCQVRWIEGRMERLEGVGADYATTQVMQAILTRELAQANHAVSRARAGGYGICERCHRPIEPARLKTHCLATTCISCEKAPRR